MVLYLGARAEDKPKFFKYILEWRKWLSENHTDEKAIWIIIQKKASKKRGIKYEEAVLEGLLAMAQDSRVESQLRRNAIRSLGQLGASDADVVNSLLSLARDQQVEDGVRGEAYENLKQLVGGAIASTE